MVIMSNINPSKHKFFLQQRPLFSHFSKKSCSVSSQLFLMSSERAKRQRALAKRQRERKRDLERRKKQSHVNGSARPSSEWISPSVAVADDEEQKRRADLREKLRELEVLLPQAQAVLKRDDHVFDQTLEWAEMVVLEYNNLKELLA